LRPEIRLQSVPYAVSIVHEEYLWEESRYGLLGSPLSLLKLLQHESHDFVNGAAISRDPALDKERARSMGRLNLDLRVIRALQEEEPQPIVVYARMGHLELLATNAWPRGEHSVDDPVYVSHVSA